MWFISDGKNAFYSFLLLLMKGEKERFEVVYGKERLKISDAIDLSDFHLL
jgi:hypothetical protein